MNDAGQARRSLDELTIDRARTALIILLLVGPAIIQFTKKTVDGYHRVNYGHISVWISSSDYGEMLAIAVSMGAIVISVWIAFLRRQIFSSKSKLLTLGSVFMACYVLSIAVNAVIHPAAFSTTARTMAAVVVVLTLVSTGAGRIDLRAIARASATIILMTAIFQFAAYDESIADCRQDKCSLFDSMWTSYFPQENSLALYVAMCALPLAYLRNAWTSYLSVGVAGLLVLGSGSRTGAAMMIVSALLVVAIRADISKPRFAIRTSITGLGSVVPAISLGVSMMVIVAGSLNLFTNRGGIAAIVWDGYVTDPLFGPGRGVLREAYYSGKTGGYLLAHEHGQLTYILANAGLIGVVFFLLAMASKISTTSAHLLGAALVGVAAIAFPLEPIWETSLASPSFWSFCLWICLSQTPQLRSRSVRSNEVVGAHP
ncbi:O-antigen ligase family protein [Gordonia amicalis]|uniref:O-antigen ligase family protein n=1 Tax=Gordonia amicalis TaxID=89053 RepID=A0ABU4DL69_9ACTN|nr:O-antigen ligase family protein [Gordonia amicalis]MDV6309977.1 O-antigen ligase family protein [Gordonia amicalis]